MAHAARVFEVFDTSVEPERYPMTQPDVSNNSYIRFNHVSFSYETRKNVLRDLNHDIHQGQKVAFIGPSGGGKSTLIKLLMGFYPVDGGNIRIDGKLFSDYSLNEVRNLMGYVPQDAYLFEGTIRENIRYGKLDASDEEIISAAKAAYAHEFIERLPSGYDTEVLSRGQNLSGGERQRIAIARAFLKNAPILLLDEATSALDNESEAMVQKGLDALMENRTVLIIAHRLTTVEKCDRMYVVKNGDLIVKTDLRAH
jgi:ABC-type multidrug transport system fused ATPase/permease subunit